MSIADNLSQIRERIAKAASRSGRRSEEVTLMAVSKTFPAERIEEAYAAGQRIFGENRVQEFDDKSPVVRKLDGALFHLIGHLQSNKAARAAELFDCIDTLDSARLARKLNETAGRLQRKLPVLIEMNVGGEQQKSGVPPVSLELEEILTAAPELQHLRICGLMTIPPWSDEAEHARPYFRMLCQIREDLAKRNLPCIGLDVLSMGMSHDFEVAIEEGSTQVRIGTAIFGRRTKL